MKQIRTEIEIDAAPDQVWSILTDFAAFPDWNPLVYRASGRLEVGGRLEVAIRSGARDMVFRPVLLAADAPRELRWRGVMAAAFLFSGEHWFRIEPLGPGRVRFVHGEDFGGLLVPLLWSTLDRDARASFEAMNRALKVRAEQQGATGG